MKKEIKDQWVKALTSGVYRQGYHRLKQTGDEGNKVFCCLGVLCDIYGHENKIAWEPQTADHVGTAETFLDERLFLPLAVIEWAGLKQTDTYKLTFDVDVEVYHESDSMTLDYANDNGVNFKEIAKAIEDQL